MRVAKDRASLTVCTEATAAAGVLDADREWVLSLERRSIGRFLSLIFVGAECECSLEHLWWASGRTVRRFWRDRCKSRIEEGSKRWRQLETCCSDGVGLEQGIPAI